MNTVIQKPARPVQNDAKAKAAAAVLDQMYGYFSFEPTSVEAQVKLAA